MSGVVILGGYVCNIRCLIKLLVLGFCLILQRPTLSKTLHIVARFGSANLLNQYPGEDHVILNLTHPPLVILDDRWEWKCLICRALPSKESDSLVFSGKKDKKLFSYWEIDPSYFWSTGDPVTGYDVKRTLNLLRTRLVHINRIIKSVDVDKENPRKFRVVFRHFQSTYPQLLALRLIPKNNDLSVSYGPYRIAAWTDQNVQLSRNSPSRIAGWKFDVIRFLFPQKNIWDLVKRKPSNATIVLSSAFRRSLFDHESGLDYESRYYDFVHGAEPVMEALLFNLRNPKLVNSKVRRKLSKTLGDFISLNESFSIGSYVTETFSHPSDPICPVYLKSGDRVIANEAKIEVPRELELVLPDVPDKVRLSKLIEKAWSRRGITVIRKVVSESYFREKVLKESNFRDLALVSWKIAPGTIPLDVFHSKEIPSYSNGFRGLNLSGWVNREVDTLFDKLRRSKSPHFTTQVCEKLQVFFGEDQPMIPIVFRPYTVAASRDIIGFSPTMHLYGVSLFGSSWDLGM